MDAGTGVAVVEEEQQVTPSSFPLAPQPGAVQRQFMGLITEEDARRIKKKWTGLTPEEALAVDLIAQDPSTDYTSSADFLRHWAYEGILAHMAAGFNVGEAVGESMKSLRRMRQHHYKLKIRGEFDEMFEVIEVALDDFTEAHDWDAIILQLSELDIFMVETQSISMSWASRFEEVIGRSRMVRLAVDELHSEWGSSDDDEKRKVAAQWTLWLETLQG